jgi:hypothetical protein
VVHKIRGGDRWRAGGAGLDFERRVVALGNFARFGKL